MGHFKSISRKQRQTRRFIYGIIIVLFILFFAYFCKSKWQVKKTYLKEILSLYMQIDLKQTNNYESSRETKSIENHSYHYMEDVNNPLVYIYNSHQSEKYAYNNAFNIDYDVLFASQLLKTYLDDYQIPSVVEMTSIVDLLNKYHYQYSQSYEVSRLLLEQAKNNYPSLRYYIDLHRDSSDYDITTCVITDKKYARFLFVIGLDHDNYEKNEIIIRTLNDKLKEQNECLSRGIMRKSGNGVNGIYNQDFDQNVMLIEVGGQYNSIEEVNNSLAVLAMVLANYIKEDI